MDIRQLKYFVVSSEMNSFSAAAKVLYTSQSNVSKAILALENELGAPLFVRESRGIELTSYGQKVYQYATRVLDDMELLENISKYSSQTRLHISTNPSSWFAGRFCEFYNLHYDQDYHFHIRNSSTTEILNRVHDGRDELGFVYVFKQDHEQFQYLLKKNALTFLKLADIQGMMYLGKKNKYYQSDSYLQEVADDLRFIQMYQDDFISHNWTLENNQKVSADNVAVITNSDYIMEKMLNNSALCNISAHHLTNEDQDNINNGLDLLGHDIVYGVVFRQNERLSPLANEYIAFIKSYFT